MRALLLSAAIAALPAAGSAGAWARGDGEAFVSVKASAVPGPTPALDPTFALYGEYGLTPRLTLGASWDKLTPPYSLAKGFARWNVTPAEATWQIALEAGGSVEFDDTGLGFGRFSFWTPYPEYLGADAVRRFDPTVLRNGLTYYDAATGQFVTLPASIEDVPDSYRLATTRYEEPETRTGLIAALHLGRGFDTPLGNAWIDARLGVGIRLDDRPLLAKLDVVAGLSVTDRSFVSLEMRGARTEDYRGLLAVPTLGYEIGGGLTATLGAIIDARDVEPARMEVGAWLTF